MAESGSTSSKSKSASGQEFPFSDSPPLRPSQETVLNPEGRAAVSATPTSPSASSPQKSSEIHNLLFPDLSQISPGELPPSPTGIKLSHFEIVDRIGTGGMGSVFLALDLHLQRYVALKILSPSQARDPSAIQRFINEARAAARLDYDGIARVHFYGEDQGYQFIAFEYVTGTNIRELIQHHGPLNPSDAINYTLQIAHALKHTSAAGVVHRDIKPSNIIVNPAGRAKLVDLGLARKESSESMDDLTVAGTTLGTFDYISPEQAQDPRNVDVRSDIYSLGCTLFHMLTGEPPYPEGTLAQKLLEHQQSFVPNPSDLNRQVPAQLAAVCQKMMASDPKRRYQSPESLIRDLLSIATEQGLKGVTPEGLVWSEGSQSNKEPFLSKHAGWLAAIAVLCLIVIGIERLDQEPNPIPSAGLGRQITESGEQTPKVSAENSGKPAGSETDSTNDEIASPTAEASERIGGSLAEESPTEGLSTNSSSNLLELIQPDGIFNSRSPESNDFDLKPLVASNDDPNNPTKDMTTIPLAPSKPESDAKPTEETEQTAPPLPEETEPSTSQLVQDKSSPVILWSMGSSESQSYNTLEAACANARSGSIIELRYNGFLANGHEKPITINKNITIRAGTDFQPVISFSSRSNPDESDTNMITVREGTLNLVDIGLHFQIEHSLTYPARDHWTLISVQGMEKVSLKNVTATIENPDREPACMLEFTRGLVTKMPDMDRLNSSSTNAELDPYVVSVRDSMLRGECDGLIVKSSQPGQIRIENSVLAVEGSMFVGQGSTNMPKEDHQLGLTINHSTIFTGTTTFQFDTGEVRRLLLPVSISTENSIYAVVPEFVAPLVSMRGATNPADLRGLLSWYGDRNYYHGYQIFWTITDHLGSSELSDLEFSGWQSYWNQGDKTFEENAVSGLIDWTQDENITNPKFSQLIPNDLQIQTDSDNQQDFLASDGSVLGAAVQTLPTPPQAPLSPID